MKDHCTRVLFNWMHGACHWEEEDPWRYCYSFSRPNEPFGLVVEWVAKQCEAASRREPKVATTEVNIPVRDKGQGKIVDNMEEEKRCKVQVDPLVHKAALEIEVKKKHHNKRNMQRQREKWRMEETEKELHDLKEQLRNEQELCR